MKQEANTREERDQTPSGRSAAAGSASRLAIFDDTGWAFLRDYRHRLGPETPVGGRFRLFSDCRPPPLAVSHCLHGLGHGCICRLGDLLGPTGIGSSRTLV